MSRVLLQQYSFKSTLVRVYLLPATLTVTSANACGLPFDLMEAADGPSNKSRLLGKEPIAWEGRNKSRAVLHCDSGYLLWQGVVSPLGRVVVVMGDSDRCIAPFLLLPSLLSSLSCFLPCLVPDWTSGWHFLYCKDSPKNCCAVWSGPTPQALCASCRLTLPNNQK